MTMVLCLLRVLLICILHLVFTLVCESQSISQSQFNPRSILLKPSVANSSFGSGSLQTHIGEVTNINDERKVIVRYQNTWQFILTLYNYWAFDSVLTSTFASPLIRHRLIQVLQQHLMIFCLVSQSTMLSIFQCGSHPTTQYKRTGHPSCGSSKHIFISGDVASLFCGFRCCLCHHGLQMALLCCTASFTVTFATNRRTKIIYWFGNDIGQSFVIKSIQVEAWETGPGLCQQCKFCQHSLHSSTFIQSPSNST
eukprot:644356_1